MNIEKQQIDDLNLKVVLTVSKDDYAAAEKKKLNERKRTAEFKGFRKGMVPMSLIQHVYGEQALVESVNQVISESLNGFINENNLRIVGEPLNSEDQPEIEWKSGNEFVFHFDLATTPELDFEVSESDKIVRYTITPSEEGKAEMKANLLKQYGSLQEGEAAGEEDFVVADLIQEDKVVEGAYIAVRNAEGDAHASFLGAKPGDRFEINVNETFTNETDRASMLKVKKEDLAEMNPVWTVEIVNVKTFVDAEANQETFDKIFGEGNVKSEAEFDAAIEARLVDNYRQESDYTLSKYIRAYFVDKAAIALPEAFLKRWLFHINEGKFTMEQIEKEFDAFLADFRWQMVRSYIMEKNNLKVEESDLQEAAEAYVSYQYAMYGMGNVPQDLIKEAAKNVLSDERQMRNVIESVEDQKVFAAIKEKISYDDKTVTVEEFRQLA